MGTGSEFQTFLKTPIVAEPHLLTGKGINKNICITITEKSKFGLIEVKSGMVTFLVFSKHGGEYREMFSQVSRL